jgi:hypothetical protein
VHRPLTRHIIAAHDDRPLTAHEIAAGPATPNGRQVEFRHWQTEMKRSEQAMAMARSHAARRSQHRDIGYGVEALRCEAAGSSAAGEHA